MSDTLPAGAKIPVSFQPGQPLTAEELNLAQTQLLSRILNHTHAGDLEGKRIGSEAIADKAVKGIHIAPNAIGKGHLESGSVGESEIRGKEIRSKHLSEDSVTTAAIKNGNVTQDKLSDEVKALLNAPREGPTTYCYCTYVEGSLAFPVDTGNWYKWLTEDVAPIREYGLDVKRLRDDGGYQIIDTISTPVLTKSQPLKTMSLNTRVMGTASAGSVPEEGPEEAGMAKMSFMAAETKKEAGLSQLQAGTDMPLALNFGTSANLLERSRVSMEINPAALHVGDLAKDTIVLNPGTGGNVAFNDKKEQIVFQPGIEPSADTVKTIDRMLYNYGIENVSAAALLNVGKDKVFDFLNNPHLLPAGYWTGTSRNVESVIRMKDAKGRPCVRVTFSNPYSSPSVYVVSITPESRDIPKPLIPMVLNRSESYVEFTFMTMDSKLEDIANFNLVIHGELAVP
ncbi:hypothetical protein E5161_07150 [Cohnella pontilimi]|uniref:Uncharacterized protein n=1 Tax=Cohnella pontilimi TaxID=2564100 RepID=A0A4U0FGW3_9BACL|nr:hypothetical protein [Cohnella pontilimi]TJY42622.1 hypothetical protein E5161_07150 [Cohnella pontilimi]